MGDAAVAALGERVRGALARFPDAVLTGRDADGAPVSVRCRPVPDGGRLRIPGAPGVDPVAGPASLLAHSHDENLWTLRSVVVRGELAVHGDTWVLTPSAVVPGTGLAGPLGDLRAFVAARRRAGRWLARRGLPRPRIPWEHFR